MSKNMNLRLQTKHLKSKGSIGWEHTTIDLQQQIQSKKMIQNLKYPKNLNATQTNKNNMGFLCQRNGNIFRRMQNQIGQQLPTLIINKNKLSTKMHLMRNINFRETLKQKTYNTETSQRVEDPENTDNFIEKIDYQSKHLKKFQSKQTTTTWETIYLFRPPSLLNNEYDFVDKSEIIFKKDQENQPERYQEIIVFWKTKSTYVRIIKARGNQEYSEQQDQHKGLLKIYGKLKIKFFTFLITESFKGLTLENTLQQFGPCSERLIKKYLKTLINGLSTMHSKGHAYNILTPSHIFVRVEGDIAIDTAKAKSTGRLTLQQKKKFFYYISPQLLINGENGFKNDTWSLGCIVLSMILGIQIDSNIKIHPFNDPGQELQRQGKSTSKAQQILRRVIKFKKECIQRFNQTNNKTLDYQHFNSRTIGRGLRPKNLSQSIKSSMQLEISEELYNFVMECFKIEGRTEARNLLDHAFLSE